MTNSTLKLLFAGTVTLGGLIGDMTIILTGMVIEMELVEIIALASVPNGALLAGMAFFFGHSNGIAKQNGH